MAPERPIPAPPGPAAKRVYPALLGPTIEYPGGILASATPTADVRIQGVPCAKDATLTFHRNGRLAFAVLAHDYVANGETIPAGTRVGFETDGRMSTWIATRDTDLPTRVLLGSGEWHALAIPAGSHVTMEHGQLRSVDLAAPLAFDGLAFPTGTTLIFGDSGALSHATSPEPLELRGIRWAAHETVVFEFGHLREGYPAGEGTYDGVAYQAGEIVRLHDNGALARCYLAADTTLSGVPCMAGTRVYLDDEKRLIEGTIAIDTVLAGIPVAAESTVLLAGGTCAALTPREDVEVDGVPCAKGALVELDEHGHLLRATLARAIARDGWTLPAGCMIVLGAPRVIADGAYRGTTDPAPLRRLVGAGITTPEGRVLDDQWRVDLADGQVRSLLPVTGSAGDAATLRTEATITTPAGTLVAGARTTIELRADGTARSLVLARDQPVGAYTAKGGTRVHFHDTGAPSNLYLAEDTRIDGIPCAAARTKGMVLNDVEHRYREEVRFTESGQLVFATLAETAAVPISRAPDAPTIPLARGQTVARWPDGTLHVGTLAARWTHPSGCTAQASTLFGQFEDGSPSLVTLDAPFTLAGTEYAAGTVLELSAPGVVRSAGEAVVPLGPLGPLEPLTP